MKAQLPTLFIAGLLASVSAHSQAVLAKESLAQKKKVHHSCRALHRTNFPNCQRGSGKLDARS